MGCWGRSGHCVDTGGEGLKREGMGRKESRVSKSERHICWGLPHDGSGAMSEI